ncbi:MAG: hypothetical protein OER86_12120 [Phycisphaerae bacterium]|nr:hypothetical protein [Phycisphaerae bacterium]
MGLLDFFRPDPSAQWPSYSRGPLRFDLTQGSVDGFVFGDAAEYLRRLGRPDNRRPFRENTFRYLGLGLIVDIEHDRIEGFELVISPQVYPSVDMQGCVVEMACPSGAVLDMTGGVLWERVAAELGDPAEVDDEDPDDLVLTYRLDALTVEFECRRDRLVAHINVYRNPN